LAKVAKTCKKLQKGPAIKQKKCHKTAKCAKNAKKIKKLTCVPGKNLVKNKKFRLFFTFLLF
jgi:hypothetical protein